MMDALWVIPLLVVYFCFVLKMVAWLAGWSRLARQYRTSTLPDGTNLSMQSGRIGLIHYGNCLTIRVCTDGLYLAVFPLFRFGHPPLLIPWSDLHVLAVRDRWWGRDVTLTVGTPSITQLRLPLKVLDAADTLLSVKVGDGD
jgi:hypothetical protein